MLLSELELDGREVKGTHEAGLVQRRGGKKC